MARVLVTRFSSFGDVALLVPAVYSAALAYPQVHFTVMTRSAFVPLFEQMSFNVSVIGVDLDKKYSGIWGTIRLMFKVNGFKYTHVADMHDVLRTKLMRWSTMISFARRQKIDKGRKEKKEMIHSKVTQPPLEHMTQRYLDVFGRLGFYTQMTFTNIFEFRPRDFANIKNVAPVKQGKWVGIAPFAKHLGKVYPTLQLEKIIKYLIEREDVTIFLFGGSGYERATIDVLCAKYEGKVQRLPRMRLKYELILISYLDLMISMDSANMHLASLCSVPVVSFWGATHPSLGFYGLGQDLQNAIQLDDMACRPCSVYGENACPFAGADKYKCMKLLPPQKAIERINVVLGDSI